jgi:uncharacterized membrane protein
MRQQPHNNFIEVLRKMSHRVRYILRLCWKIKIVLCIMILHTKSTANRSYHGVEKCGRIIVIPIKRQVSLLFQFIFLYRGGCYHLSKKELVSS